MESSSSIWNILPNQLSRPQLVKGELSDDPFWSHYETPDKDISIHIAILAKLYLNKIITNEKTIESRFSIYKRLPYKKIRIGDVVLLKQTSGPIRGLGYVKKVHFVEFNEDVSIQDIKSKYNDKLKIQDEKFWIRYSNSSYGSLIYLDHVREIKPMQYSKRDSNAWLKFTS